MKLRTSRVVVRLACVTPLVVALFQGAPAAQDRLKALPGYDQYQKMSKEIPGAISLGSLAVAWSADGTSFEYTRDGTRYRYDVAARAATQIGVAAASPGRGGRGGRGGAGGPERGRQLESAEAPGGGHTAVYHDRNLWIRDAAGTEVAVTTDGSAARRVKYGTASWVYGEELAQRTAMWWSPDGRRLAYYRFDESDVPDYHLQVDQTELVSRDDVEAYPKAGAPNPVVDLFVYDVARRTTTEIDVRDGQPFTNDAIGHYVYRVSWSADGRELLFHRTNRRQNVLEVAAANPETGRTRVVLREEWRTGWVDNSPSMTFLADGRRFIWQSERTGWSNLYLYDLDGRLITPLTNHDFEVGSLVKVDEQANVLFYTARDGDNYMKLQLHRVGLDGKGDVRLTDPAYAHTIGSCMAGGAARGGGGRAGSGAGASCGISPDNRYIVDVYQRHDTPPATRLVDSEGRTVAELASSHIERYRALGFRPAEMFTFTAADGRSTLHGLVQFPSTFDPAKKYPVLVPVYGGPASASNTARETFVAPNPLAEYGFLIVNLDTRGTPGQGRRLLDSIYRKLGQVEIDDMAMGVRSLAARPYVDLSRVGIYGTSYGGYSSLMSILRHPDVYAAASSSSPVTDWKNYDSIYTERYMWIPQENEDNYRLGSALPYARDLRGRLMLYYGTADNNVHPSNMMQLIKALQEAGKSFEVQVGPDRGHSGINQDRMMEFFIENLIVRPASQAITF